MDDQITCKLKRHLLCIFKPQKASRASLSHTNWYQVPFSGTFSVILKSYEMRMVSYIEAKGRRLGRVNLKRQIFLKKKSTLSSSYTVKCHHHTLYEKIIPFKFLDCTEIQSKTQLLSFVTIVSTAIMITIVQRWNIKSHISD